MITVERTTAVTETFVPAGILGLSFPSAVAAPLIVISWPAQTHDGVDVCDGYYVTKVGSPINHRGHKRRSDRGVQIN